MPNWCYNNMDIIGDRDELQKFVDATKTVTEDGTVQYGLNHLFPIPAELQATPSAWYGDAEKQAEQTALEQANIAKHGYKDWYDWACDSNNWGTKWGACDFDWKSFDVDDNYTVGPTETYISAYYETAWGPADGLIRNISAKFPKLIFTVVSTEESDAFACYSIFRNGFLEGEGGEEPVRPAELEELYDKDPDAFFEQLGDWQCEVQDKVSNACDKALAELMSSMN